MKKEVWTTMQKGQEDPTMEPSSQP